MDMWLAFLSGAWFVGAVANTENDILQIIVGSLFTVATAITVGYLLYHGLRAVL